MNTPRLLASVFCLFASMQQAGAAIIGSCTIMVQNQGTLTNNPGINVLSSKQAGGSPVAATVTTASTVCIVLGLIDCYSISAPAPSSFTMSPGSGGTNVSFATTFKVNGSADKPGNVPFKVPNGTYNVSVDLSATKNAGIFTGGNYRSEFLIRCE